MANLESAFIRFSDQLTKLSYAFTRRSDHGTALSAKLS